MLQTKRDSFSWGGRSHQDTSATNTKKLLLEVTMPQESIFTLGFNKLTSEDEFFFFDRGEGQ